MIDERPSKGSVRLLRDMLEAFVQGREQSKEYVERIEYLLITDFIGTQVYEDLTQPVASYDPKGGEYLYDVAGLTKVFKDVLETRLAEG